MNATTEFSFVYMTAADKVEAAKIGRLLVEERLAACVNILPGMNSIYHWQGKIEESAEVVLIAKTRTAHVPAIIDRVRELHSDSCPCVVSWPLREGNEDYLQWIFDETTLSP